MTYSGLVSVVKTEVAVDVVVDDDDTDADKAVIPDKMASMSKCDSSVKSYSKMVDNEYTTQY